MKLEYNQRVSMLSTDKELKKNKVDKLWNSIVGKEKEIAEDLFNLLYENKNLSFDYQDINVPIVISEEKTKNWNKRYYHNYKTHILIREKIPLLKKQGHITSATADKIKEVLNWMNYCEEVLSTRVVESKPLEIKPTQEIIQEKRNYTGVQLMIPFDEEDTVEQKNEENKNEGKGNNDTSKNTPSNEEEAIPEKIYFSKDDIPSDEQPKKRKVFSDEEMEDIYAKDKDEPYWNR